jgi:hypothetical protein
MKITENLKNVMKGFEGQDKTSVKQLALKLGKTENSIRSTLSVSNYKQYFEKETKYENDTKIITYNLSAKGLELIANNFQEKENN